MLSFFPRDVLDEIWDLIESVSEGFPSYSCMFILVFTRTYSVLSGYTSVVLYGGNTIM